MWPGGVRAGGLDFTAKTMYHVIVTGSRGCSMNEKRSTLIARVGLTLFGLHDVAAVKGVPPIVTAAQALILRYNLSQWDAASANWRMADRFPIVHEDILVKDVHLNHLLQSVATSFMCSTMVTRAHAVMVVGRDIDIELVKMVNAVVGGKLELLFDTHITVARGKKVMEKYSGKGSGEFAPHEVGRMTDTWWNSAIDSIDVSLYKGRTESMMRSMIVGNNADIREYEVVSGLYAASSGGKS